MEERGVAYSTLVSVWLMASMLATCFAPSDLSLLPTSLHMRVNGRNERNEQKASTDKGC